MGGTPGEARALFAFLSDPGAANRTADGQGFVFLGFHFKILPHTAPGVCSILNNMFGLAERRHRLPGDSSVLSQVIRKLGRHRLQRQVSGIDLKSQLGVCRLG